MNSQLRRVCLTLSMRCRPCCSRPCSNNMSHLHLFHNSPIPLAGPLPFFSPKQNRIFGLYFSRHEKNTVFCFTRVGRKHASHVTGVSITSNFAYFILLASLHSYIHSPSLTSGHFTITARQRNIRHHLLFKRKTILLFIWH